MTTETKEREKTATNEVAQKMQEFLAGIYTLYVKTQNFHWNVTGPLFPQLHELFDKQYKELAVEIDEVAEQIRSMGFFVPASLVAFEEISHVQDQKGAPMPAQEMIRILVQDHQAIVEEGKELFNLLEDHNDPATSDLVIDSVKRHQKNAWMLRSSLEK